MLGLATRADVVRAWDAGTRRFKLWAKPLYRQRLIRLATRYRTYLDGVVVVGVTGSCGKTTTKDLTAAVLARRFVGTHSRDTNNGAYAAARTLLATAPWMDFCVAELGTGGPGTLDRSLAVARPRVGVVLNVRSDHRQAFQTLEATAAEKGRLVDVLPPEGTAVLCADDPRVLAMARRCAGRVLTFGLSPTADVRGEDVTGTWPDRLAFRAASGAESVGVQTRLCGTHWLPSVLAALAVGRVLGVPLAEGARAVGAVEPFRGRMQPVELGDGVTFIRDDFKAAVSSLPAALEFLRAARAPRKILVLGTLRHFEGTAAETYAAAARDGLLAADRVFLVGPNSVHGLSARRDPADQRVRAFDTVRDVAYFLREFLQSGDLVLLKGHYREDHLTRIVLHRRGAVACWRAACGRGIFCESCALVRVPAEPAAG